MDTQGASEQREWLSARDLAAYLDVPLGLVYEWSRVGGGPPRYKIGKYLRYRTSEVEQWLTSNHIPAA